MAREGKYTVFKDVHDDRFRVNADSDVSHLTFCADHYKDEAELFAAMGAFLKTLMDNEQEARVRCDSGGIYVVEYSHDNNWDYYGSESLYWLNEEESETIDAMRNEATNELESAINGADTADDVEE